MYTLSIKNVRFPLAEYRYTDKYIVRRVIVPVRYHIASDSYVIRRKRKYEFVSRKSFKYLSLASRNLAPTLAILKIRKGIR